MVHKDWVDRDLLLQRVLSLNMHNYNKHSTRPLKLTSWRQATCSERVTNITRQANTVWYVVYYLALCIVSTLRIGAGIYTVKILTGLGRGAFRICSALWSAGYIRIPEIVRNTLT